MNRRSRRRGALQPPPRMPAPFGARYAVLALLLLAGLLALELAPRKRASISDEPVPDSSGPLESRLLVLERADPALVARLRALDPWPKEPPLSAASTDYAATRRAMEALAPGEPKAIALALLRILVEDHRNWVQWVTFHSYELNDRKTFPVGTAIGDFGMPDLAPLLSRALAMRDYPFAFRRNVAVALCQEGCPESAGPLAAVATDRSEDPDLRRFIMRRIHRIGGEPPPVLEELLYEPFREMDVRAAMALARWKDPGGAPILRSVLERFEAPSDQDMNVLEAVKTLIEWSGRAPAIYRSSDPAWVKRKSVVFLDALDKCVAKQIEVPRLQRERQAYLASELRLRELAAHSWEDLLAAGDDFDFAAMALLLGTPDADRAWQLERIHRLSLLAHRKLRGVTEPREQIRILDSLIYQPHARFSAADHKMEWSFLPKVFAEDHGNCLGYSTLYLALADRLRLPLHAVNVPGHVFVRWDDGRTRFNIETTDAAREKTDQEYDAADLRRRAPELTASGAYLGNLSRRQTLALVLNNRAATLKDRQKFAAAEVHLQRALALFPDFPAIRVNLIDVIFHHSLDRDDEIVSHARAAFHLDPGLSDAMAELSEQLIYIGKLKLGTKVADRVHADGPSQASWSRVIWARLYSGRIAEADRLLRESTDSEFDLSLLGLWREFLRDRSRITEVARQIAENPRSSDRRALVRFFEFVLALPDPRASEAEVAIRFLASFVVETPQRRSIAEKTGELDVILTMANAYLITGDEENARELLGRARDLMLPCRGILKLERELRQR